MEFIKGQLDGIFIVSPGVHEDKRGFFFEAYHQMRFKEHGITAEFVQDNQSFSGKGTLRGLHYQIQMAQDKLIRVLSGEIFDVALDIRQGSPSYGLWEGVVLSAKNKKQLFIPKGFAHGFQVISDEAEILYKCSDFYSPQHDRGILWSDPEIGITWPIPSPVLSDKDKIQPRLKDLTPENLFHYD